MGENRLKVAEEHGHSPEGMMKTYAKGITDSSTDVFR